MKIQLPAGDAFADRQLYANTVTNLTETYDPSRVLKCHPAYRSPHLNLYHVLWLVYSFLPLFTAENGSFLIGVDDDSSECSGPIKVLLLNLLLSALGQPDGAPPFICSIALFAFTEPITFEFATPVIIEKFFCDELLFLRVPAQMEVVTGEPAGVKDEAGLDPYSLSSFSLMAATKSARFLRAAVDRPVVKMPTSILPDKGSVADCFKASRCNLHQSYIDSAGLAAAKIEVRAFNWHIMPALAILKVCCSITSCNTLRVESLILSNSSIQQTPLSANTSAPLRKNQ
uniref:Uncharacterized protein n=1 Tax=Glossina palpalis gambiensis TaxID=67801 RepID=A0A1B0BE77_9MUSC